MGARLENYKEDSIIIKEGATSKKIFVVLEGAVALYMNYGQEDEYLFGVVGKNKTFGEMGALSEASSIYTAVAFSDVKLAWFDERSLGIFFKEYPDYAINMVKNLSKSYMVLKNNLSMALEEVNYLSRNQKIDVVIEDNSRIEYGQLVLMKGLEEFSSSKSGIEKYLYKNCKFLG